MDLHPQARAALGVQPKVPLTLDNVPASRASMVTATPAECGTGPAVDREIDLDIAGMPARIYHPGGRPTGAVVYVHGGGWILGELMTHDAVCRALAVDSGHPVLAVDYRRAPEHPHPAAVEDVERAVGWLRGGSARHELVAGPVAICGDSAGGHLATVVARRARDRGEPLAGQVLVYPVIDPEQRYPALDGYGLDAADMRFFWDAYAPPGVDRDHPDVAPLRADLAGLPPTLVITAEYDILRDEGERYAAALSDAGVPTVGVRYLGLNHGFFRKLALFDAAATAVAQAGAALRSALRAAPPAGSAPAGSVAAESVAAARDGDR